MSKYEGETRLYGLENGSVYKMPSVHCVFCKHCTDLFYDYTNGPYMFCCDKELELNISETGCSCVGFEDDGYVLDEEEQKKRMEFTVASLNFIDKIIKSAKDRDKYDGKIIWKRENFNKESDK